MAHSYVCRAGIDGGGVFKEFFTSLCKEVFDTDRGLWLANKKNELYPNPHSYATERKCPLQLPCPCQLIRGVNSS
jgi:hypothetical protein